MRKIKRVITIVGNLFFFGGYFYVIFWGFMCPPNVSTRTEAIKWLILSVSMAALLPGIICLQAHEIRQLEKRIVELEKQNEEYSKIIEKYR